MSDPKKMALFRASPQFLRDLFQLPAGAEITGVRADGGYRGVIEFRVEGYGPLTAEGMAITPVCATVYQDVTPEGRKLPVRIEWGTKP